MERISEEVTQHQHGSGLSGRPWPFLILNAFWVVLLILPVPTRAQTSDVLIIEKTDRLSLFDAFQRSVTKRAVPAIPPFTPLRILRSREILNDGITPTMKIEADGVIFYLLCDGAGRLVGRNSLGMVRTFVNCRWIGDTVEVLRSSRVMFRDPVQKTSRPLPAGEHLARFFEDNGSVYVKRLSRSPAYGWTSLPMNQEGMGWRIMRSGLTSETLPTGVLDRMNERVRQANQNLLQIYSLLNAESGKRLAPPQWRVRARTPGLYIVDLVPASSAASYSQSLLTLASAFQTYLLGTGFGATTSRNTIEVRRR